MSARSGVHLRPAMATDSEIIFSWQHEPETRRHARQPRPPSRAEHESWMARKLADVDALFQIIENDGAPAGVLRLDPMDGPMDDPMDKKTLEVSIFVAPEYHGRGIAKAALAKARKLRPAANLRATVLPGNDASHALFRASGYQAVDEETYVHQPFNGRPVVILYPDGAGAGMGHARRLASLAPALENAGMSPLFLVNAESGLDDFLEQQGLPVFQCDGNPDELARTATGASAFVVDHYRLDVESLSTAAKNRFPIIAFDDTGTHGLAASMIVNGSPAAETFEYSKRSKTPLLLGPDYQIVRGDLVRRDRNSDAKPSRLLVTIGGGDPLGIGPDLLRLLENTVAPAHPDLAIDYVAGPLAPAPQAVTSAANSGQIRLHHAPNNMATLISNADVAVSGGGQTLFELLYCGVPTIAIRLADNQRPNIDTLVKLGCLRDAGRAGDTGWLDAIETELDQLLNDAAARRPMAKTAMALCDGRGAERVSAEILHLCANNCP